MRPASTIQYQPIQSQTIAESVANLDSQFMGTKILPIFDTDDKTAIIPKWSVDETTKSTGNLKRNPSAGYARVDHTPGKFSYECEEYGLEEPLDDSDRRYLENFLEITTDISLFLAFALKRQQEKRIAALVFNETTFAGYTSGVSKEWSNNESVPVDDVQDAILTLKQNVGGVLGPAEINLEISEKVFRNLMKNTQIQGLRAGGNGSNKDVKPISAAELAFIFGVNNVYYSPAQDDAEDIWDDEYALLNLSYSGQMLRSVPHLGRSMLWKKNSPQEIAAEIYRSDSINSDVFRVRHHLDEVIFTPRAGYLISNITAD